MNAAYAVVGDPIAHSLSPVIQQAAFDSVGLDAIYSAIRADQSALPGIFDRLRGGGLDGFNVTMPNKERAFQLVDSVEGDAHRAGSVNTVVRRGSAIIGLSTDVGAIRDEWNRKELPEGSALILGSGGAAAAALVALDGMHLYVAARSPDRTEALLDRLEIAAEIIPWGTAVPGAIVVNATPLGMKNEVLPTGLIAQSHGLFDMAYGALPTPAVTTAWTLGLPVVEGVDMLVAQAALSFEVWTGIPAPYDAMRRSCQIAQGR